MYKQGILDNAGKAVTKALGAIGFEGVNDVRIGKTYTVDCREDQVEAIAKVVTNQVMEDYKIVAVNSTDKY
jgi:phosphoribosylformylglycinamidine synthase PurS subunit